jgi:hypothetical protein
MPPNPSFPPSCGRWLSLLRSRHLGFLWGPLTGGGPGVPPKGGEGSSGFPVEGLGLDLCRVMGLNQNYLSALGTLYHIQIEDRGPVVDPISEADVRRVNVIVYANYGEPNARIILGRDHDFPDIRTREQNRFIEAKIQDLALGARRTVEEREQRLVLRIKGLVQEYHRTRDEALKREFEELNAHYPFVFSRAWIELKQERVRPAAPVAPVVVEPGPEEVLYPLDPVLRELVIDIERVLVDLEEGLEALRASGRADDILMQSCRKLADRARDALLRADDSEFRLRRLEMTRNSLATAWRQVRSRLQETTGA